MENNKNLTKCNRLKDKVILLLLLVNLVVTGGLVAHELGWLSTKPRIHSNHALESQMQAARKYTLSIGTNDKDTYT